jgi:polysaccharide chain length determinant protein (PEP-CTERM system associated)
VNRTLYEIAQMVLSAGWRRRFLICVPFLLMIPISVLASRFAPKTYESKTILLLQETGKENPFLKDFAVGLNVKDRILALQVLLRSEHVLLNVLRDISSAAGGKPIESDPQELALRMSRLSSSISVELIGTDLLELKLKGDKPTGLGDTLAAISNRFLERLLAPERSTLGATKAFLQQQTEQRRQELQKSEQALSDFRTQHADKLPAVNANNITRLGQMKQRLEEKSMELSAATAGFQDMRKQLASTNPIVGRLEESIVQVTGELTSLRSRYTEDHSDVQAAERRLSRLQEERRSYIEVSQKIETNDIDRLWNMAAGEQGKSSSEKGPPPLLVSQLLRLQDSQGKRVALEKDVEQLKLAVDEVQHAMAEYAPIEQQQQRLEKEVSAARELLEGFAKRLDNATTSLALGKFEAPERVKIIDPPQDPTTPTSPARILFVIAGIIAGLAIGVGLAIVAELLDQRVRSNADFSGIANAPVLGRLPAQRRSPA